MPALRPIKMDLFCCAESILCVSRFYLLFISHFILASIKIKTHIFFSFNSFLTNEFLYGKTDNLNIDKSIFVHRFSLAVIRYRMVCALDVAVDKFSYRCQRTTRNQIKQKHLFSRASALSQLDIKFIFIGSVESQRPTEESVMDFANVRFDLCGICSAPPTLSIDFSMPTCLHQRSFERPFYPLIADVH